MKETLLTYCKYVLFAAALIPLAVIVYVMLPVLSWPFRIGALFPFIVLLLWGALALLKQGLDKRAQKPQAPEPLPEPPGLEDQQAPGDGRLDALQKSWKASLDALKSSHLKQEGNPLYVLPWYLVLGESGSGKSTAIRHARLESPFSGSGVPGASGTGTCDWYFYEQAVVIDSAGRYAAAEAGTDQAEWRMLLFLLRKHRRAGPINGVVLTLPADMLLRGIEQELEDYGRHLRARIEEMTRYLGVRFPVYLLVTKADLIEGVTEFAAALPGRALDQPMGLVNDDGSEDTAALLQRFSSSISERLRTLRLYQLCQVRDPRGTGSLLSLPMALRAVEQGLQVFLHAACGQNHYQETPYLRGLYLCSGKPEPASQVQLRGAARGDEGVIHTAVSPVRSQDPHPGREEGRGIFLHDFFQKVLPADRSLWTPSASAARWRRLGDNLAFISWMLVGASLCGLLTCSFVKNMAVLREASAFIAATPELRGETAAAGLPALARMGRVVSELERKNQGWWVPRLGLTRSIEVEQALKARYCREFRDRFLSSFDRDLAAAVETLSPGTPDQPFGAYVLHMARRCNLLKGRLQGELSADSAAGPLPEYPAPLTDQQDLPEGSFGTLYLNYLAWSDDQKRLSQELSSLQRMLKRSLSAKGGDFKWMVGFVDRQLPTAAVTLRDFWSGSRSIAGEPAIPPSFTRKGYQSVLSLFSELGSASPEPGLLEEERATFFAWYGNECYSAWERFATLFPSGEQRLAGSKEWHDLAGTMSGDHGAYFSFIRRTLSELEPFRSGDVPSWLAQLQRFQALKSTSPGDGTASSTAGRKKEVANRLESLLGREGKISADDSGAGVAQKYLAAVAQVAPVAKSRTLAYQMARSAFGDSAEAKSALFQAADAAQKLNAVVGQGEAAATFSRLIYGPIAFYGTFIRMETACALQEQWEARVLKEVQGAGDPQALQYLLGKEGPVWRYVTDFADPFLGWSPGRGYYAKTALGGSIPFRPEFYSFLAKGAKAKVVAAAPSKAVFQVTVKGLPTDANSEARVKPHGTRLELQCTTGSQVITNMNYPVTKPLIWSPDSCGDVLFQIEVGDTVLTRRYPGARGFQDFLRDFPGGRHTFYPRQFPGERQALEQMGIRFIRVNYQLFGAQEIPSAQDAALPGRVPEKIAECWD